MLWRIRPEARAIVMEEFDIPARYSAEDHRATGKLISFAGKIDRRVKAEAKAAVPEAESEWTGSVCRYWQQGRCTWGVHCNFSHEFPVDEEFPVDDVLPVDEDQDEEYV